MCVKTVNFKLRIVLSQKLFSYIIIIMSRLVKRKLIYNMKQAVIATFLR